MIKKISSLIVLSFVFFNLDINAGERDKDPESGEPPLKKASVDSTSQVSEGKENEVREQEFHPISIDMTANFRIDKTIIVKLNLSFNDHLDNVNFLLGFPTLTDLNLCACEKLRDNYRPISQLTNLERLNLYGIELTTTEYLIPLIKLKYLKISCHELGKCIEPLASLNLKELDISGSEWKGLTKLSRLISLESITFRGFWTGYEEELQEEFPPLDFLTPLVKLKILDLSCNQYITSIRPIVSLPNLTSLNLFSCSSIEDLDLLTQINSLRKLTIDRDASLPDSLSTLVHYFPN